MQKTDEQQSLNLLTSKLKSVKGKITVSDAATLTGLAIHEAKDALDVLMNRYACKLQVTESGEILYSFGDTLRRRGEKTLNDYMEELGEFLWKAFKVFFKIWITVMLVVYFVIFVIIVIAAIIAMLTGSKGGGKKIRLGWIVDLFADLFTATARAGVYVYAIDTHGYRHRTYAQAQRKDKTKPEIKKRFVQSVYDYVFGPLRPEYDPLANAKEAASYLRASKGILTTSEVVALAGYSFDEADDKFTDYLTRFQGRPDITEDGVVFGKFDQLLLSAGKEIESIKVELFWDEYEAPFNLNGNSSGRNTFITFANAFNLILSFIFLTGDYESVSFGQNAITESTITIVLGWIPFIFSAIFFLVPLVRFFRIRKQEQLRRERNIKRRLVRYIYLGRDFILAEITEAVNRGSEEKLSEKIVDSYLNKLLLELQGETKLDENGIVQYSFPRIAREYQIVKKLRESVKDFQGSLGQVIIEN